MKRKWGKFLSLALLLAIVAFSLCIYREFNPPIQGDVVNQVFGQQNYDALMSARQATAQLLHNKNQGCWGKLSCYEADAAVTLSQADIETVRNILVSPKTYRWDVQPNCIPDYGVLFTFQSGQQTTRVGICLKCDLTGVVQGMDENTEFNSGGYFRPGREKLLKVIKMIFPASKDVQAFR